MKNKDRPYSAKFKDVCEARYEKLYYIIAALMLASIFAIFVAYLSWVDNHYLKGIDGCSMQPGINDYPVEEGRYYGDCAVVNYRTNYDYGDIVIIDMKLSNVTDEVLKQKLLIKRVIAKAGDSIKFTFENGFYYTWLKKKGEVKFTQLQEDYIYPMTDSGSGSKINMFNDQSQWPQKITKNADGSITIPEGQYFVMGDNRDVSYDCRIFGPLEHKTCIGVVETILKKGTFLSKLLGGY